MNLIKLTVIFCTFILVACQSDNAEQKYILARTYSNYAWGEVHNGIFIKSNGELYSYSYDDNYDHDYSIPNGLAINEAVIDRLLLGGEATLLDIIDIDVLNELKTLMSQVSSDHMTEVQHACDDAGVKRWFSFTFDKEKLDYTPILLEMRGDAAQLNLSPSAKKIVSWLRFREFEYQIDPDLESCNYQYE